MHRPHRSKESGRPHATTNPERQPEDEPDVHRVQKCVDHVITERPIRIAEEAVVQQVRKRRRWAIERRISERPPVRFVKNQVEIRCAQRAKPRVFEEKDAIVEDNTGAE